MLRFGPNRYSSTEWLVALLLLLALIGCAGREVIGPLTTPTPPPFSASGDGQRIDRWWMSFDDPGLNVQVEQALEGNYTLAAALQRLRAARAVTRREASDFYPDVNAIVDVDSGIGPGRDNIATVWGLDAAYQVDLWGQIESRVEAERLRAEATEADFHAVALTLSAEVARTWYSLIESHAQAELLVEQIETNRTGLELQETRFGLGLIRSADVLRQRQLLQSTLEQAVVVQSRIEVLEHQLAVLLGQMPQTATYDPGTQLPALPPLPQTGLPSELLQRRPDVRRDFLAFAAADRDLAAAITDQYPRISLTGSLLNVADRPETLFRDWFVSIGGSLVAPLIDGGQRRAEVTRSGAVVNERFQQYGQTMLTALGEVEDNLARERYQVQRLQYLDSQVELARQASEQLREQYLIGDTDYLSVLTAIQAQQRLQRETLSARLELILIRVALYLALAGDFQPHSQALQIPENSNEVFDLEAPAIIAPENATDE